MPLNPVELSNLGSPSQSIGSPNAVNAESDNYKERTSPARASSDRFPGSALAFDIMSPAREYMDVALNGLAEHCEPSGTVHMPSVRTLLGTERYRDTRFGDEPIIPWGTPTIVDFGPSTPLRDGIL